VHENYAPLEEFSEKRSSLAARGPSAVWVWPRAYFQEEVTEVSVLNTARYLEFSGREANAKFLIDVLPTMKLKERMDHNTTHSKTQQFSKYINPKTQLTITTKVKQPWVK